MAKPWAKYEIDFLGHAKFLALTSNAICLWFEAKNYCDKHHTDGLFPREALRTFRFNGSKSVELLTRSCGLKPNSQPWAPLWEAVDMGGVPYLRMHDYLSHNDCRDEVLERLQDAEDVAELRRLGNAKRQRQFRAERKAKLEAEHLAASNAESNAPVTPVTRYVTRDVQTPTEAAAEAVSEALAVPSEPPKSGGGVTARSKKPIYQSDRFAVFEWQFDAISQTLGPHLDAFDLHGFFDDLTQRSRESGLVIPSDREARWQWLQAQIEAEARRRGLPMADAAASAPPVLGKLSGRMAAMVQRARQEGV